MRYFTFLLCFVFALCERKNETQDERLAGARLPRRHTAGPRTPSLRYPEIGRSPHSALKSHRDTKMGKEKRPW
jgi:hypothetical protein